MKIFLSFCILLFGFANLYAQDQPKYDTNQIFTLVQQQAKFPGGNINGWLSENIVYPEKAKNNNVEGKVYVSFVVERNGSVSSVKVLRGIDPDLDQEAVRVISSMPKWSPGMQNGHTVRQLFNVPINFILNNNSTPIRNDAPANAPPSKEDKIFTLVQQQPKFPGDVSKWLAQNIVYPQQAKDDKIEGTVFVNFVVEKDGSLSAIKLMRGVDGGSSLNDEALRVINSMPKWTPGVQDGLSVRTQYMLPVHFTLDGDNSSQQSRAIILYNTDPSGDNSNSNMQRVENADGVIIVVDEKPEFHGSLLKYLADNVHYPESLKTLKTENSVQTSFVVEANGKISDARVEKKGHTRPELEAEALRVINAMPKWKPAMQNGKPIAVRLYISVPFFLDADEK